MSGSSVTKCAVGPCDRDATAREWCKSHWARWSRTGDPGTEAIRQTRKYGAPRGNCAAPDCDKTEHCKGYCKVHYWRLSQQGDIGGTIGRSHLKAIDHEDGTRTCNSCGVRKQISAYLVAESATRGRRATCAECNAIADRDRRQANAEEYRARAARNNAARRGVVIVDDVSIEGLRERDGTDCNYCGRALTFDRNATNPDIKRRATIDHVLAIINGGEHSYENTVLACQSCNSSKRDQLVDVWLAKRAARAHGMADSRLVAR